MNIAKTHLKYKDKYYFISTINRECSSMESYGILYTETIAWEWNPETNTKGCQVTQDAGPEDSIQSHLRVIQFIYNGGLE